MQLKRIYLHYQKGWTLFIALSLSYIQQEISKYESQLSKLGDFKLLDTLWQSIQTIQTEINIMRMDFIEIDGSACIDTIRNKVKP